MAFLERDGVEVVLSRQAPDEESAVAAAREIGYPVAVKLNSPDVTHKSDVGGVVLNVKDEAGVRKAFQDLEGVVRRLGARSGGVLVSAMAARGLEIIVGVTRDLQFGHAVMFGIGGILVEVFKDVAFRIVPFSEKDAAEMIGETRGAKLLEGVRGGKPADVAALRRLLVQVSSLVKRHPEIDEMDLNPVIVHEKGLTVVDAAGRPVFTLTLLSRRRVAPRIERVSDEPESRVEDFVRPLRVRRVAATRKDQRFGRTPDLRHDGVHLLSGAVLVVLALHDEDGALDRRQILFNAPLPELGSEPHVGPRPKHRVGVAAVMPSKPLSQVRRLVIRCDPRDALEADRSTTTCGASRISARTELERAPAWMSAIDAPSL